LRHVADLLARLPRIVGDALALPLRYWPLASLDDWRHPRVSSAYRTRDRPRHDGADIMFRWLDTDPSVPVGDGGAVKRAGVRRWFVPDGTLARATEAGRVQLAGESPGRTGLRVWVRHIGGVRTGYFHLADLRVRVGDIVIAGQPLGLVGDNPRAHDPRHLHFEASPAGRYAPFDPAPYLAGARYLSPVRAAEIDATLAAPVG
jgi:murein DD-endopeptidase MepM/ murein hydrolase activator NlpD